MSAPKQKRANELYQGKCAIEVNTQDGLMALKGARGIKIERSAIADGPPLRLWGHT